MLPIISDFEVVVRDGLIEFLDGEGQRLAWFPAWEHADRDLRHFIAADVPFGSVDEPYEDGDEGWAIRIFLDGAFVHVMEADGPDATNFPRAFRVPRDTYLEAWARVIDEHNPILPLDAVLPDGQEPS
ncbi:MAG: hypothetical protein ABI837_03435 [Acidobacteriota bacterium]